MFLRLNRLVVALLAILLLAGCAKSPRSFVAPQASTSGRSTLSLASAGEGRFTATLRMASSGARVQYALDPPTDEEIAWKDASAGVLSLRLEGRSTPYVLLARTIGPNGSSTPERFVFSENVIYKITFIESPRPTRQQPIDVPPTFDVAWSQHVVDAPAVSAGPTFLTRVVSWSEIAPAESRPLSPLVVTAFFRNDLANNRAAWTSTTATTARLENQEPVLDRYFAVVALDAAGQPEPSDTLFSLDTNVLWYRATQQFLGPDLFVFNEFFNFRKTTASLDATPVAEYTIRPGATTTVNWAGFADVGKFVTGYRWALDLSSVSDESPRRNAKDLAHWSDWSLTTTSATVGPFSAGDANKAPHLLYVETRDNLGGLNLVAVSIRVSGKARAQAQLLVIDDLYGIPTESTPEGEYRIVGAYPMEAEQDSFHNAVGGVPDELRRHASINPDPNALSVAGAFAGFPYDTLDYKFWPLEIPLETLSRYQAVAWYTDLASAVRSGDKFSSVPMTALRWINFAQRANTLAQYVASGGKLWLFGAATNAIANGYWSRIGQGAAPIPYRTGDERGDILKPGNFLYDFVHLRATLNFAGNLQVQTQAMQLKACIPYLPQFAGPASDADRSHDPRIGPSAARTAGNWDDLPRLTIAAYRGAAVDPAERSFSQSMYIASPLELLTGSGKKTASTADTLYLCQARVFSLDTGETSSDGKPNAIWYHGGDQGDVVWFGFPLVYFELGQVRQVVGAVMRNFGIAPLPAGVLEGPGAAEPPAGTEDQAPVAQRVR